jgi:thiol-disulfide isomerase/thioredoxin
MKSLIFFIWLLWSPIFTVKLQKGETIQIKPAVGLKITQETSPMQLSSQESDHFTIIGKTTGFKDSTKLYLHNPPVGSVRINLDSTYVINNSFTFKGTVSEPLPLDIHTGYTGWKGYPPENFYRILLFVNNSTIYLNDEIGNLKFARISGSELQNDNNEYNEMCKTILLSRDSMNRLITKLDPSDTQKRNILRKEIQENHEAEQQISKDFIRAHPKSIISVLLLNIYKSSWGNVETKDLFYSLVPQIQNTTDGKSVKKYIKLQYSVDVGDSFVDIELQNLKGEFVKLSSLKGKYVLLEFWAAWCGPCRSEHPGLLKLYNQYKEKGFEIYAVSLDDKKENWQQAVKDDKINWITVSDLKGATNSEAAMIYEVTGIPKNYLIDRKGKIIVRDIRGEKLAGKLKKNFKD